MQPGHEKIRRPQDPAGRFLKNAPEKFSCPWARERGPRERAPTLRTQNGPGLPPRRRTMSRVPQSPFHAASCAPPSGRMFPKAGSCFLVPVSVARCRSFFLPVVRSCAELEGRSFAGTFSENAGAQRRKRPARRAKGPLPDRLTHGQGSRPALRGRSIAEPAHDAVRSDAPVHGGRLLRRCCRAFEPDDSPARRGPFPGKLLPKSCPEPEKAAGPSRKHEGPGAPGVRRGFHAGGTLPRAKLLKTPHGKDGSVCALRTRLSRYS